MAKRREFVDGKLHCWRCDEWKLPLEFNIDSKATSGRKPNCKVCEVHLNKNYYRRRSLSRIRKQAVLLGIQKFLEKNPQVLLDFQSKHKFQLEPHVTESYANLIDRFNRKSESNTKSGQTRLKARTNGEMADTPLLKSGS